MDRMSGCGPEGCQFKSGWAHYQSMIWTGKLDKGVGKTGRGSAWLERLVRDQEVGGSNPLAPNNILPEVV